MSHQGMDIGTEEELLGSKTATSEEKNESLYSMFFGVSCAIFALRILSETENYAVESREFRNRILQVSAQLFGCFIWGAKKEKADNGKFELLYKLENAEREIEELKRLRREDAKANEKVVSIYAAQEQHWFNERKQLRRHIGALINDLRVLKMKKDRMIAELDGKLQVSESALQSKDKTIANEEQKRGELEELLRKVENNAEELRNYGKIEAQRHATEMAKHKTAFIELVSNQRQLEAEMARALRQVEAAKQELDSVLEQKEQAVLMTQKLSMELIRMRRDLDQKDQILSAMLRKSKLDTEEKQMLLKEVKFSKAKKKQAELETQRWKAVSESKVERLSLRSMLTKHTIPKSNAFLSRKGVHSNDTCRMDQTEYLSNCDQHNDGGKPEIFSATYDQYFTEGSKDVVFATGMQNLESWVQSEADQYKTTVDERHCLEIDAFAEQLRLKDEKLEAFRWRLLSTELESKRLQSHVEGLNLEIMQLREANLKLEAMLLNREEELHSAKEQLKLLKLDRQKNNLDSSFVEPDTGSDAIRSSVKIIKRIHSQNEHESKADNEKSIQNLKKARDADIQRDNQPKDVVLKLQSPEEETGEGKIAPPEPDGKNERKGCNEVIQLENTMSEGLGGCKKINSPWKMDLHALGVSYKIKRLKQQFLMLERLTGKQENSEKSDNHRHRSSGIKQFYELMVLLNKQADRYQSMQGKIDDLCKRMHENNLDVNPESLGVGKTKEEIRMLEQFLEETFQLQRYIVATGQKLMEVQSKIASGFEGAAEDLDQPASFDIKRFADGIRTLFREVQRGLEVRIARIIGDLEGTLACDGITQFRK